MGGRANARSFAGADAVDRDRDRPGAARRRDEGVLAEASGGRLRYSVAGADLSAVPGGVWASFRTGMMGLTVHLGANGLPRVRIDNNHTATDGCV